MIGEVATGETPLARYLREHHLRQVDFAAAMTAESGFPVQQSAVSMWATGQRFPSRLNIAVMAQATGGAVDAEAWTRWRRRQARGQRRAARRSRKAG